MTDRKKLEQEAARFQARLDGLRAEVARVIVGQEEVVDATLTAIMCGGNVLLEGVPGLGKRCWSRRSPGRWTWSSAASSSRPTSCRPTSSAPW